MSTAPASIPRRHDLDALRAIAMLLGIALHGALAYIPLPDEGWPVHDLHQGEAYAVFMSVIHGFRMPLFFLISGFFTAMLWRKRGLGALLVHRAKRIFLPLVIGTFTIVPAVWIVSIGAGITAPAVTQVDPQAELEAAIRLGQTEKISNQLAAGASVNQTSRSVGATPLSIAASRGEEDAIAVLLENGGDVNARNRDGRTPLHSAALFGEADAARMLIDAGADTRAVDGLGESVADTLQTKWMNTAVIGSMVKVDIVQFKLIEGRQKIAGMLGPADQAALAESDFGAQNENTAGLFLLMVFFPLFHHLWFLWYLCLLVVVFAIYASVMHLLKWKVPAWLVVSPLRYAWLLPLTLVPQSMMGILYPNFGPDTSAGLLPMPAIFAYYVIFFLFGAMLFDHNDQTERVGCRWRLTLPIALLVVFPIGYELSMGGLGFGARLLDYQYHRSVAVLMQVLYVWMMSFGLMGMFRELLSAESRTMRYISDSSYWLYLAHLPLIIVAQALVRTWPIPALAKLVLICTATSLLLLISYQLFVRYTPVGTLLNGPRQRPQRATPTTVTANPEVQGA